MKKCGWCGREYSDDVSICAVDQNVLVSSVPPLEVPAPESEREASQPNPMKYFLVPIILWGYILSVILAKSVWSDVFERFLGASHWTLSQQLRFMIVLNLFVAGIGAPQVLTFIAALKRREIMSVSQHVGSSICIAAASMCVAVVIVCFTLLARRP